MCIHGLGGAVAVSGEKNVGLDFEIENAVGNVVAALSRLFPF